MTDTLTTVPSSLIAGDSLAFTWTHADYPRNDGWSAALLFAGGVVSPAYASTADASDATAHVFTVPAADTADASKFLAGTVQWRIRVTKTTTTKTADYGVTTLTADLATLAPGEALSYEETLLPIVEAALSGTLAGEMQRYKVGNPPREIQTFTLAELLRLRSQLQTAVQVQRGQGFGTPVRFDVVRS